MQITETHLTKLIEDVEREFSAHLAKAESAELAPLSKAEGEKKPEEKEKEDHKPEEKHHEEGEKKPEAEAKAAEGEKKPEASHEEPSHEGHDYDDEDLEHMHQMYSSMSKGELKAHHDAIMKCSGMMKNEDGIEPCEPKGSPGPKAPMGMPEVQKNEDGIESSEPKGALGPKSPASDANGAKINKAEAQRRNGGKMELQEPKMVPGAKSPASDANGDKVNKSEGTEIDLAKAELSAANAKYEELKKNFDAVAAFLTKLVEKKSAPAPKAITSLDTIAKSEGFGEDEKTLSKKEVHDILCKKSSEPALKKSDREAINVYYAEGQVDIKGISHLLK